MYLLLFSVAQKVIIPIQSIPFTNCNKCFASSDGVGYKERTSSVLQKSTNADSKDGKLTQKVACNRHEKFGKDWKIYILISHLNYSTLK